MPKIMVIFCSTSSLVDHRTERMIIGLNFRFRKLGSIVSNLSRISFTGEQTGATDEGERYEQYCENV